MSTFKKFGWLTTLLFAIVLSACAGTDNIVPAGQIAVKLNPAFLPGGSEPRYTQIVTAGNEYNLDDKGIQVKNILIVPEGKLGWDGTENLLPGPYPNLAEGDITVFRDMTIVAPGWLAVRQSGDGAYEMLQPGRHYVPADEVVIFPTGSQRYRTLRAELLTDPNACASYLCETTLDRASVADSNVEISVDLDLIFHFNTSDPAELWKLQDPRLAVQNFIGSTLRGSRTASAGFTSDELKTQLGRQRLEMVYQDILVAATDNTPIVIDAMAIRSITFGDEAWRQQQIQRDQELAAEQSKQALLREQQNNLTAENELKAARAAFVREQALLDAENQVRVVQKLLEAYKGVEPQVLWVLLNGGQVPPFMNSDGSIGQAPAVQLVP